MNIDSMFRVIEILDTTAIIINYGKNQGAQVNDYIRVIEEGPEVIDPRTKEVLGTLDNIKETLTIDTVYDNFSICKKKTEKNINPLEFNFNYKSTIIEQINVDESEIGILKKPKNKPIKVGDRVEII